MIARYDMKIHISRPTEGYKRISCYFLRCSREVFLLLLGQSAETCN